MKTKEIILAGAALAVGLFVWRRRGGAATGTADAQRMAGLGNIYRQTASQQDAANAAIRDQWASMNDTFRTQPDFYA